MELVKDLFFFIGSVLGILAFLKTLVEPMVENNRIKWKSILERITEEDFINLESEIWFQRRIRDVSWTTVQGFIRDIEEGAEYLRFTSVSRKLYQQSFQNLRSLYWKLSEFIQVPYWEPYNEVDEEGNEFRFRRLNKEYFWKHTGNPDAYVDHLEAAAETVEQMRLEFRRLSVLSNLHSIQIPFAKRIVARDAQIPKRRNSAAEARNSDQ